MAAHSETFPSSPFVSGRFTVLAFAAAAAATALTILRNRLRRPALPRMSSEWLVECERRPGADNG